MDNHPTDSQASKPAGRGLDLFFGDEAQEEAADLAAALPDETEAADSPALPNAEVPTHPDDVALQADVEGGQTEAEAGAALTSAAKDTPAESAVPEPVEAVAARAEEPPEPVGVAAAATATSVGDLPVVAVEPEERPQPETPASEPRGAEPPPLVVQTESAERSGGGFLSGALLVLLGAVLGAALALVLLASINGGLRWTSATDISALQSDVVMLQQSQQSLGDGLEGVGAQVATMGSDVQQLQAQAANLAGLPQEMDSAQASIGILKANVAEMQTDLDGVTNDLEAVGGRLNVVADKVQAVSEQVDTVSGDLVALTEQVDRIAVITGRTDKFLSGIRRLLSEIYGEPVAPGETFSPTTALSATVPLTATIPVPVTPLPTASGVPSVTEAVTTTVPLTTTEAITVPQTVGETGEITPTEAVVPTPGVTTTQEITTTTVVTPGAAITATTTVTTSQEITTTEAITETELITPAEEVTPPAPTPEAQTSISGLVYDDQNNNGQLDSGEPGVAGVRVTVYTHDRVEVDTTVTDENGEYGFFDLPPGRYLVTEQDPRGYRSSTLNTMTVILRSGGQAVVEFGDYKLGQ